MNNYLLIGHVCDCDNEVKIVTATSSEIAEDAFKEHLKEFQDCSGEDIYIDTNQLLEEAIKEAIIAS